MGILIPQTLISVSSEEVGMEEIKTLYNTLYENPAALSVTERKQLVQDFGDRADHIISTGHGGQYTVARTCPQYIFNGVLVRIPDKKRIVRFQILLDDKAELQITDEMELLTVHCQVTAHNSIPSTTPEPSHHYVNETISCIIGEENALQPGSISFACR